MADIGTAYVRVAPNMTGIQGKIAAGFKGAAGPATSALGDEVNRNSGPFQAALGRLGSFAKGTGVAIGAGLAAGAAGLAALTGKALLAGAELEQQLGGAEAVFGQYADSIKKSAEDAFFQAGLSQTEFLQGANKMGSLFQGAGFDVQSSMKMSAESMQRASDIASIMGIDTTAALEAVTGMAKGNFTMMDNLGVAMNDTSIQAYALSKGINKTTAQMSIQEKVGLAQQMFMEKTAKFAGNYAKENQTLAGSINSTKKAFDNLLSGGGGPDALGGFIELLVNTIELAVPQLIKILPKIVTGIEAVLKSLVPALSASLPTLVPALIQAVQGLLSAVVAALPNVVQTLVNALPLFISAFIQIFLAIVKALPQIIAIIAGAMPTIINALVTGLTSPAALTAIIMGSVELLLAIIKAIPIIIPAIVSAMPIIIKNIISTLTSPQFISAMTNAGVQLVKATISGLVSLGSSLVRAARDILNTIQDTLSPSNMARIGGDLIRGLWNGISSLGGWLKDRIIGFVKDKIPGPVRKALGINSPSKVFAEFGRNIDQGLVKGVDKHANMVEKSVNNMANSALAGMSGPIVNPSVAFSPSAAAAYGSGSTNNTSTQTVSIQKVVLGDESAVRAFFGELNQDTINLSMGITPRQGAIV